jgi:hypothetical protein
MRPMATFLTLWPKFAQKEHLSYNIHIA